MLDWMSSITRRGFLWITGGLAANALQPDRSPPEKDPLQRIVLSMTQFHASVGRYPFPAIYDHLGRPVLSWRVALLPYLGEYELFRRFVLDEPWDSPHNLPLLGRMPQVYAPPGEIVATPGATYYRVFEGPGAAFETRAGLRISDFPDGIGTTILVAEAADPVPWTKPEELRYDPDGRLPRLGSTSGGYFRVAYCDGSVKSVRNDFDERRMRLAIVRHDGYGFPEEPNQP
jgi:hypothetical protein